MNDDQRFMAQAIKTTIETNMKFNHFRSLIPLCVVGVFVGSLAQTQEIPPRPEEIEFPPLQFEPPHPSAFRHELSNGIPVYLAPSHEFPLIDVRFTFKGGSYLDPDDQVGLAGALGAMMRTGGTQELSADQFDEEVDFLAANIGASVGATQSSASLNALASNFDEAFALFIDMVRRPAFQEDRLDVYKHQAIERMRQRNDRPQSILNREWNFLMYGSDHYRASQPTLASIESITKDDLQALHESIFQPGNLIVSITGDFDEKEMLAILEKTLSDWPMRERVQDPPAPEVQLEPGVYRIEMDIPQGNVAIGQRAIERDHPDYFPMLLLNDILGGSGFTSRVTRRVRSDEGLAYSAWTAFSPEVYFPGELSAGFQSQSRTVALAAKIIFEEFERIRTEPVSEDELAMSKASFIETFPRRFESRQSMLAQFVNDELTGRDPTFWQEFRANINAVTADDILRVAKEHIDPQRMIMLVVGRWDDIAPGDLQGRASMAEFFGGEATELPLRDPLTLR